MPRIKAQIPCFLPSPQPRKLPTRESPLANAETHQKRKMAHRGKKPRNSNTSIAGEKRDHFLAKNCKRKHHFRNDRDRNPSQPENDPPKHKNGHRKRYQKQNTTPTKLKKISIPRKIPILTDPPQKKENATNTKTRRKQDLKQENNDPE